MNQAPGQPPVTGGRAPVVALLAANAISGVGNVLMGLAVPWFVYDTTGSVVRMRLERANRASHFIYGLSSLVGPPLAGVLITWLGSSTVLWIDAATFAISAAIIARAVPSVSRDMAAIEATGLSRYLRDVADGFRFLRRDRVLFWMVMTFSLGSLLAEPLYAIVLPVYAKEVFGSAIDLGIVFAALGAGSLVGNGVYAVVGQRVPAQRLLYRRLCRARPDFLGVDRDAVVVGIGGGDLH